MQTDMYGARSSLSTADLRRNVHFEIEGIENSKTFRNKLQSCSFRNSSYCIKEIPLATVVDSIAVTRVSFDMPQKCWLFMDCHLMKCVVFVVRD
jgi:hypothetical protein